MFEFSFRNVYVAFDFSFFAAVSLLILMGNSYAVLGLAACIWHELGHLFAMKKSGIRAKRILFYGAGIKIYPDKQFCFTDFGTEFFVLIAGSTSNFLAAILLGMSDIAEIKLFSVINAVIGVFNLLPLQYLDGGKLIVLLINKFCSYPNACLMERYLKWLNVFLIVFVMICFAFVGKGNFTLYITLCYLLISALSC